MSEKQQEQQNQNKKAEREAEEKGEEEEGFVEIDHKEIIAASGYQTQHHIGTQVHEKFIGIQNTISFVIRTAAQAVPTTAAGGKKQPEEEEEVQQLEVNALLKARTSETTTTQKNLCILETFTEQRDGKVLSIRLTGDLSGIFVETAKRGSVFVAFPVEKLKSEYPELEFEKVMEDAKEENKYKVAAARRVETKQRFDKEKMEKYVVEKVGPSKVDAYEVKYCRHCSKEFGLITRRKTCATCGLTCLCSDCVKPEMNFTDPFSTASTTKKKDHVCFDCVFRCLAAAAFPHKQKMEAEETAARSKIAAEQELVEREELARLLLVLVDESSSFAALHREAVFSEAEATMKQTLRQELEQEDARPQIELQFETETPLAKARSEKNCAEREALFEEVRDGRREIFDEQIRCAFEEQKFDATAQKLLNRHKKKEEAEYAARTYMKYSSGQMQTRHSLQHTGLVLSQSPGALMFQGLASNIKDFVNAAIR